mmetsp:Transcript_3389/g.5929  ORF Transcript_3389/g.5929 Transcript_3389/m.5929 type:complete len:418 (+) Transcript_3389:78-1331(+)
MYFRLHLALLAICSVHSERPAASRSALESSTGAGSVIRFSGDDATDGTEVQVPQENPIPGSQTWPLTEHKCEERKAYTCGDGEHCCCRLGCTYDVEKDACTACDASDPLVVAFHIPSSHLWAERAHGECAPENSHICGRSCCCNAEFLWNLETRKCEHVLVVKEVPVTLPETPVPSQNPIPGSQTWKSHQKCESKNAYLCDDGKHCCCRMGCSYDAEYDECRGCRSNHPDVASFHIPSSQLWESRREDGKCTPAHSHVCGESCCCNAAWRWDLEQRQCVRATATQSPKPWPVPRNAPPKAAPIAGSEEWTSCEARFAYKCGGNHCCCMFGCEYDVEKDSCTGCKANNWLVQVFHIPASHRWNARHQAGCNGGPFACGECDAQHSHRCGWSCCCNAGFVWDMEKRRCSRFSEDGQKTT